MEMYADKGDIQCCIQTAICVTICRLYRTEYYISLNLTCYKNNHKITFCMNTLIQPCDNNNNNNNDLNTNLTGCDEQFSLIDDHTIIFHSCDVLFILRGRGASRTQKRLGTSFFRR